MMEFNCLVVSCTDGYTSSYHPFAGNDTVILTGDTVQFNATGGSSYTWTPSTYLSNAAISNPVGTYPDAGTFTYILHGVSDSGCAGNDTVKVTVLPHAEFVVPNAFTPNGDNVNDLLVPIPLKHAKLKDFRVFARSGKLVYNCKSANEGWDGKCDGKALDMGTYAWEVLYDDEKGITRRQSGNVTLIR